MRFLRLLAAALLAATIAAPALTAQAPTTGWRAEFLFQFNSADKKFNQLAEATPWEKFSWRPSKGVRSVCEVFLHIAGDNYMMMEPLGAKKPASVDYKTIETCPDSKAKVLATMKAASEHARNAVIATQDTDADFMVEIFGMKVSKRGLLLLTAEHMGEHLGQSIAYARVNGIVPPWSAKGGM
jgi:uncharacterized damage-inducible protein DinB